MLRAKIQFFDEISKTLGFVYTFTGFEDFMVVARQRVGLGPIFAVH